MVKEVELHLQQLLRDTITVTINCDIRSSKALRGYLGVTVHLVDQDWKPRNYPIACPRFTGKHDANSIFCLTIEVIQKFQL